MIDYRRYPFHLLAFALSQALAVALFNFAIDPYGIMLSPTFLSINKVKPSKANKARLFKAIDVIHIQPQFIFLGSSRTEVGLDPYHPFFKNRKPTYNLGLSGANMYESRRYFEHALFVQPDLKIVVLGIDMLMFINLDKNKPDFLETRLEKKGLIFQDILDIGFSIDTLVASIKTIQINKSITEEIPPYYPMGLRNASQYKKSVYQNLPTPLIFKKFLESRDFLRRKDAYQKGQISESFLNDLQAIVRQSREREIKLKLFISPIHVTQLEALRLAGLWPLVEQWKREVVKIAPIWDFSGYNSITTEPITNQMKNYLESSHYLPEVGNFIFNKLFEYNEEGVPADFGILITEENIESNLEKIRADREAWAKNNPDVVRFVEDLEY